MPNKVKLLLRATKLGNVAVMETLIQSGANVNFRDDTHPLCALDIAAEHGDCAAITLLLNAGAGVDGVRLTRYHDSRAQRAYYEKLAYDFTPLMRSIQYGHINAIKILLSADADISFSIFNQVGSYCGNALTMAVLMMDNSAITVEHQCAIVKELLPAADRCSSALRQEALMHMEEYTRISPNGEKIHVSSGGMALPTPNAVELDYNHRKDELALILRHYGTFQYRLNAINFDDTKLSDEDKQFYQSIIDPITQEIMNDPIVVSSGQRYDRQSLIDYFRRQIKPNEIAIPKTMPCPLTRELIRRKELDKIKEEDNVIRNQINDFVTKHEQHTSLVNISSAAQQQPHASAGVVSRVGMFAQHGIQSTDGVAIERKHTR